MAAKRQQYIVGVDLGGTNIMAGALSVDGREHVAMQSIPTYADGGADAVADRIIGVIDTVMRETELATGAVREDFIGIGVGAPGPLDRAKGLVVVAPNLGWKNFPLRDRVSERTGLPVSLDNDANCATVGEWWQGAARGGTTIVGMTIGTGIGGGLIIGGELLHGASDVAGEIGHTTIELNGRHCKCGNYGCLEAYASGPAIATRAREVLVREESVSLLPSLVDGHLERITAYTVYKAAQLGDALANEVVRDTARYLGAGIANLLNIINADVVVVAGGVTQAGDALFVPLRAEVRRRAFRPAVDATRIVPGELAGTAGVVGAVATFKMSHLGELIPPTSRVPRRLGVIGSFVWDVIHGRDPRRAPTEEWGGIAYALSALDAALPSEWEIVPLVKVGEDLGARATHFLGSLERIAADAAAIEVPYPNGRVELLYVSDERRTETLTGGVPAWSWLGLKPVLEAARLDALYVNFLTGWELDLETMRLVRQHFRGPIYCDLHMLAWAVQPNGLRTLRPIPNVREWCECFDFLQVNEEEMTMLAPDTMTLAATALHAGVRTLVVTLGKRGAVYFAAPDFDRLGDLGRPRPLGASLGPVRTALVPVPVAAPEGGDPTGCGDVWGSTYFSRLLAGDTFGDAILAAHRAAARNVDHRGAAGLANHLRGKISLT